MTRFSKLSVVAASCRSFIPFGGRVALISAYVFVGGCAPVHVRIDAKPPLVPHPIALAKRDAHPVCAIRSIRQTGWAPWVAQENGEIEVPAALAEAIRGAVAAAEECQTVLRPVQAMAAPEDATQLSFVVDTRLEPVPLSQVLHVLAGLATLYSLTHVWPIEQSASQSIHLDVTRPNEATETMEWTTRATAEIHHLIRTSEDPTTKASHLLFRTLLDYNLGTVTQVLAGRPASDQTPR